MTWTAYSYKIDGIDLVDNNGPCKAVIITDEHTADLRGSDRDVPWREGQYHTPNKKRTGVDLPVRLVVRDRNSDNTVTHADGHAGHIQQNIQRVKALFSPGQHVLSRIAPDIGAQEIDVERIPGLGRRGDTLEYLAICHAAFPLWRQTPKNTETKNFTGDGTLPIVVTGDAAVPNAVITIEAKTQPVTNPRVELASTGRYVQYTDTIAAGESVEIDVFAITATHSADGVVDRALSRGFADTLVLPVGSYNLDVSSDAGTLDYDVTVEWYDLRET